MDTHLALKSCIIFSPSQDTLSGRRTPHPRRKQEEEELPALCATQYSIQVSVTSLTSAWPGDACGEWGLIVEIHYYDLILRDADLVSATHDGQLFYCILFIYLFKHFSLREIFFPNTFSETMADRITNTVLLNPSNGGEQFNLVHRRDSFLLLALSLSLFLALLHYPFVGQCVICLERMECAGMEEEGALEEEKRREQRRTGQRSTNRKGIKGIFPLSFSFVTLKDLKQEKDVVLK